jgi:hypothetical protein
MNNRFLAAFGIGIACIAIAIAGVLYMQRGAHMDLPAKILKVRTAPLDEKSSVAVVDFRAANPSDYPFVVRSVTVVLEDKAGTRSNGATAAEMDAKRLFEALPILGQKYNDSLIIKETLAPHTTTDRMVAARFEVPESALEARKQFIVRVEEIDGKVFDIPEK